MRKFAEQQIYLVFVIVMFVIVKRLRTVRQESFSKSR
jgi:hypothetical protein